MSSVRKRNPDDAFRRDVPADLQESVMERICEAAWGDQVDGVSIIDQERRNVTNIEVSGAIEIDGREFWFHVRDGDMAGTELIGWEESGAGITREPREPKALCPVPGTVSSAIAGGATISFLTRWDRDLDPNDPRGREVSQLPGKAAYDAFFAPGTGASRTHHDRAAHFGYTIEEASEARRQRRHLLEAALVPVPTIPRFMRTEDPAGLLSEWRQVRDRAPGLGEEVGSLRDAVLDRLSRTTGMRPSGDEDDDLRGLGYRLCRLEEARGARYALIRSLLSAEPVPDFDPRNLPHNPVAALFKTLDPELVRDTRMRPEIETPRLLDAVAGQMAREDIDELPVWVDKQAGRLGMTVRFDIDYPDVHATRDQVPSPDNSP